MKTQILKFIEDNYNPDKTFIQVEISDILDYFNISNKEFKEFAISEVSD